MEYRGYLIQSDGTYGYKEIKAVGRGSVPKGLRGTFTSIYMAQRAIDLEKGNKDAEASISV